jgi:hypothetical protein
MSVACLQLQLIKFTLEHAMKDQDGSYSSTLSLSSALDGGGWSTPSSGRFTPGKRDQVSITQEFVWAPAPVWTGGEKTLSHRDSIQGPSSP